ncbi:phytanoyl-CoA dioxygenase [Bradyrhizobium sp. WYCCWR 13022]|uniref:phytanoyl-CoA dioxygenase family protein n=1 Tax=unclassified Bradyrhizobium TaxID=2631580 RepID=UPI00263A773F|nr:phytanoyl-CoA dioxygenase family protein [Bradyrhizobium sp. WYCCWR 13022]MDN4986652.1 phytanoyl-CoA dioxygenase [Bradyrhizobium sp. WYCCWR 13022]
MSHRLMPTKVIPLVADRADALMRDGYLLLRGAVPEGWRDALRGAFDAGVCSGEQWAAPRGAGWRHALVDLDPIVQRTCRLPPLLAAAAEMLAGPFFLAQVEGREPLRDGGHQPLHRDGVGTKTVAALVFLDDYGPDNGATRLVPRPLDCGEPDEASSLISVGEAGDVLVFVADLPHGATRNRSGARRRSLLLSFMPARMREAQESSRALRNVRMDTSEMFVPGERGSPV